MIHIRSPSILLAHIWHLKNSINITGFFYVTLPSISATTLYFVIYKSQKTQ